MEQRRKPATACVAGQIATGACTLVMVGQFFVDQRRDSGLVGLSGTQKTLTPTVQIGRVAAIAMLTLSTTPSGGGSGLTAQAIRGEGW